jgi:squalene-hopene/tetraprenyl-beta-curcumene cyclase
MRSIERAADYLLVQAKDQFAEAAHEMNFPHRAGFTGWAERQSGDLFARATLAHLMLDIASALPQATFSREFQAIARREADALAERKLAHRRGGWSYFPGLPELPPDADSLAAVLSLFVRIAPELTSLCEGAVDAVLTGTNSDGSFETWIVAADDDARERMLWGIRNCWGSGRDVDVVAHLCHALWLLAPERYIQRARHGARYLLEKQRPDGSWQATWYAGPAYGTALVLRLLRETGLGVTASERAVKFLLASQQPDGCWSVGPSGSLQTALSLLALGQAESDDTEEAMRRGCEALVTRQLADGSWQASPWIQMEIGRATGNTLAIATYKSVTVTTGFCLRAIASSLREG